MVLRRPALHTHHRTRGSPSRGTTHPRSLQFLLNECGLPAVTHWGWPASPTPRQPPAMRKR
eukprot:2585626-Prymnesium_polylepis.2